MWITSDEVWWNKESLPDKTPKVFNVINIKGDINFIACDKTQINTNSKTKKRD